MIAPRTFLTHESATLDMPQSPFSPQTFREPLFEQPLQSEPQFGKSKTKREPHWATQNSNPWLDEICGFSFYQSSVFCQATKSDFNR